MHIKRTDLSNTEVKLNITADASDLTPIKDQVVKRLSANVKIPGFREGTAPLALIEKNLDQNLLQGDFLDEAMTQLYARATRQEKVRPVTRPEVTVKKFVPFTELEYEVTTNIIGEVKLPDYTKIKVPRGKATVTAKDVDEVLRSLSTRMADKKPVTRVAKDGDEAVIDFKGVDSKDEPIEGAEGKDYPLVLGSKTFIPGFEENVVGMKPGSEKTFQVTFPKDYGSTKLAGSKVKFTVTLKSLNELVEPKIDDEFAAKVGPFKTLGDLKEDIKRQLTAEKERDLESRHQIETVKAITDKSKVEIPQALIDQQVTHNIAEIRRNANFKGQTYEELLKTEGKTAEEHKKELEKPAADQLKTSLVLAEIAEKEKMTIESEELEIRIQQLKSQYKDEQMQRELDKQENRQDIASRMLTEKVVHFLTQN